VHSVDFPHTLCKLHCRAAGSSGLVACLLPHSLSLLFFFCLLLLEKPHCFFSLLLLEKFIDCTPRRLNGKGAPGVCGDTISCLHVLLRAGSVHSSKKSRYFSRKPFLKRSCPSFRQSLRSCVHAAAHSRAPCCRVAWGCARTLYAASSRWLLTCRKANTSKPVDCLNFTISALCVTASTSSMRVASTSRTSASNFCVLACPRTGAARRSVPPSQVDRRWLQATTVTQGSHTGRVGSFGRHTPAQ